MKRFKSFPSWQTTYSHATPETLLLSCINFNKKVASSSRKLGNTCRNVTKKWIFWVFITIRRNPEAKRNILNPHIMIIVLPSLRYSSHFWCWIITYPSNIYPKTKGVYFSNVKLMVLHKYTYSDKQWHYKEIVQMDGRKLNPCNIFWGFWKHMSRKAGK